MENISKTGIVKKKRPVRAVQFGEGNFLRAFVDYMIDILKEKTDFDGSIVLIKPISFGSLERFREQDSIYTVYLRGLENGAEKIVKRVVTSVDSAVAAYEDYEDFMALAKVDTLRFVISNTTEAGITLDLNDKYNMCPPDSYPAKLTKFLYERFKAFDGDMSKGLVILPVELIDDNGKELKRCVKALSDAWGLGEAFDKWLDGACVFTSTLVDRIVTGYPKDEAEGLFEKLGYIDELADAGEVYASWVIEADPKILDELPFDKAHLPVQITDNVDPFKKRKVRLLNGAHTSMSVCAYSSGIKTVGDCMKDEVIRAYVNKALYSEIIPALDEKEQDSAKEFADAISDRFSNPFIRHELLSILLNSTAKWKARVLPSIKDYHDKYGALPKLLTFSYAAYIYLYHSSQELSDDAYVLEAFDSLKDEDLISTAVSMINNKDIWQDDLSSLSDLTGEVIRDLKLIGKAGMYEAVKRIVPAADSEG